MELLSQIFSIFTKGGPVMYLLLLCSLGTGIIVFERLLYYRAASTDPNVFLAKLRSVLERQGLGEAIQFCERTPAIIAQITAKGLAAYQHGVPVAKALETVVAKEASHLREYLNFLSAIVTLAPLLGLLGTVTGMIGSFSVLNIKSGQPLAITGGVGEALIATATGLCVAVLAFIAHVYFVHRLDNLITDIEFVCGNVQNLFYAKKEFWRDSHEIA